MILVKKIQGLYNWLFTWLIIFHLKTIIAIDLRKQEVLDHADAKAIQQIDFTGNLNRTGKTTPLLTLEES